MILRFSKILKYAKYLPRTLYLNIKLKLKPNIKSPFFSVLATSKVELFRASTARVEVNPGCYLRIGYDRCGTSSFDYTGIGIELHDRAMLKILGVSALGHGASVRIYPDGILKIGNNTYLAGNANIGCCGEISIGDNCAISWNVTIIDSDFHPWSINGHQKKITKPIKIEKNVWIGNNVVILKGVTIGEGSIIGAGSVVTQSIPPKCLAVGNPARVISGGVEW